VPAAGQPDKDEFSRHGGHEGDDRHPGATPRYYSTLIKKKRKFSLERSGAKSYMTNDLLIYGENICEFLHILGSPFSYRTLHPIPYEFPYI
jgi:hypothetical protein